MTQDEKYILNGFCVSGLALALLSAAGLYVPVIVARMVPRSDTMMLRWTSWLFSSSLFTVILALILSIIGIVTCRKHPVLAGRWLGIVGALVSLLLLLQCIRGIMGHYQG